MSTPFYETTLDLNNIVLDLADRPSKQSNSQHRQLTERLAAFFSHMIKDQKSVESVWKPAGEWQNYNEEKNFLYSALLEKRIEDADHILKNFWRNKLGLIVKEYATFEALSTGNKNVTTPFLKSILRNYIIWKDIYNLPVERLELTAEVGSPWGCTIDNTLITPKATRFHHNAMQLKNLLTACNGTTIAEIGAGYGALCHYLVREIEDVKYIDFDLPETIVLAAYYLLSNFPDKRIFLYGEGKFDASTITKFDILLLPNYTIAEFQNKSVDVFFNSFSLSEMSPEANKRYIAEIARITKGFFLHNNMDRKGVVNRGFERIPASEYPISEEHFILLNKNYDLFHSHLGDYKEFLYKVN